MRGWARRRSTEDRSPGRTRTRCGTSRRPGESWSGAGRSRVLVSPRAQGVPKGSQLPSRATRGQSRRWRRGPSSGSSEADSAFPWRPRACLGFKCVCQNSTRIEVPRPPIHESTDRSPVPRYRFSLDFVSPFFGSEDAYATPRLTQVRRATSVWYPDCATRSHPAGGPRLPLRSNGFAPGSWSNVSVWSGSTRTIRSSPRTPTAMLPPRRKAMPPIHARQEGAGQDQTEAADDRPDRFVKRTGGREDHDASHPVPLHRVKDVTDSVREDLGRPSSCGASEGDEDGLLVSDREVD